MCFCSGWGRGTFFWYNDIRMEEFLISIENFDGPLDLMLHLIKEKKLDLFDLDMNVLADRYIAYLKAMQDMRLEIAGDYLVMLAEMIEYKSKQLLPKRGEDEVSGEEDPKDRLVRRLLEYQQFKEISHTLGQVYEERQGQYAKPLSQEAEEWLKTDFRSYEGSPYELMKAMRRCLIRMQLSKPLETRYTERSISMEDRELQIRARLDSLPDTFSFETLLEDVEDMPMFVATFLAVLDLARLHTLFFHVDENDRIWFAKGVPA